MQLDILRGDILQIDGARIVFRNFEGRKDEFNRDGTRGFSIIIPNEEIKERLVNNVNQYGKGWNVRIKPPREEGDMPFMHLPVKIKVTDWSPSVYLVTGNKMNKLEPDGFKRLDRIRISSVDLDIRPYDGLTRSGDPYRSAYLNAIKVYQEVDRFAEEEYPYEEPYIHERF